LRPFVLSCRKDAQLQWLREKFEILFGTGTLCAEGLKTMSTASTATTRTPKRQSQSNLVTQSHGSTDGLTAADSRVAEEVRHASWHPAFAVVQERSSSVEDGRFLFQQMNIMGRGVDRRRIWCRPRQKEQELRKGKARAIW
jgi:hypothetical protein